MTPLTPRERQVLFALIETNCSIREIAHQLGIKATTARYLRDQAVSKSGTHNQYAAYLAYRQLEAA